MGKSYVKLEYIIILILFSAIYAPTLSTIQQQLLYWASHCQLLLQTNKFCSSRPVTGTVIRLCYAATHSKPVCRHSAASMIAD